MNEKIDRSDTSHQLAYMLCISISVVFSLGMFLRLQVYVALVHSDGRAKIAQVTGHARNPTKLTKRAKM